MSEENKIIKVAQVIGPAVNGGTEAFAMNYYQNIDRNKVQFDFLVESTSRIIDKEKIESMGGHVVIVPSYKNPLKYVQTLTKIFKENKYDIVHSNMNTLSYFTLKAAKRAGIKVRIAHSHSTSNPNEFTRNFIKNTLRPLSKKYATNYFACSELAGRYLFGDKTFDKGKVIVINNAIDLDRLKFSQEDRNRIRNALNIDDKFVIGHVGRMVQQKNQIFLIDIYAEILKKKDNAVLMLLGDGPLRNELEDKVKKMGILDKVLFLGVHHHTECYYSAMDCTIFPSIYEGFLITLLEAQVEGLPSFIADNIPEESTVYADLVHRASLTDTPAKWADIIIEKVSLNNNRKNYYLKIKNSKYDIKKEGKRLTDLYLNLVKF